MPFRALFAPDAFSYCLVSLLFSAGPVCFLRIDVLCAVALLSGLVNPYLHSHRWCLLGAALILGPFPLSDSRFSFAAVLASVKNARGVLRFYSLFVSCVQPTRPACRGWA